MSRLHSVLGVFLGLAVSAGVVSAEQLELTASKDTFGLSNHRNRNNGASETLTIASAPNIRTIIAFDLSGVTNEITGAEFRIRKHTTATSGLSIIVAPMASTTNNAGWVEGLGNLGILGQNSRLGEACFAFSRFQTVPWESVPGSPVSGLNQAALWGSPIAALNGVSWEEGRWLHIPVDTALLEKARTSELPAITFGVWGKAGKGMYFISSRNSDWPPVLLLDLKEEDSE